MRAPRAPAPKRAASRACRWRAPSIAPWNLTMLANGEAILGIEVQRRKIVVGTRPRRLLDLPPMGRGRLASALARSKSGEGARTYREAQAPSPHPSPRRGEG